MKARLFSIGSLAAALATLLLGGLTACDTPVRSPMKPPQAAAPTSQPAEACSVGDGGICGAEHWKSKTDAEWRKLLTPEQYQIARQAGTERPFTGKYWNTHTPGVYQCAVCGQPLFSSETKFESGTGWPSYWQPIDPKAVTTHTDTTLGMTRTEVLCSRCGAHLGHVFDDGPKPTGLRYCMNSAVLSLVPEKK